jgi:DNA repair exonuclease SbcCD ATPase subunit
MITFKKIRWRNFISTGNNFTELSFTDTSTTLISGENGSGKSTLLDALTFALFNKPYRNINLPQLTNSVNEKECVVELEFTDGKSEFKVIRGQSPKVFEIWKDGKLLDQEAKARDGQRILEEQILRMNYKSFCQVVILGSANYIPFMRLPAAERRSVVESILDIGVFSIMNVLLKERVSQNKEESTQVDTQMALARERVKNQKKIIEDERKRCQSDKDWETAEIDKTNQAIAKVNGEMEGLLTRIEAMLETVGDKSTINKQREKFMLLRGQIERKVSNLRKEVEFYQNNNTCPTCSQALEETLKHTAIETKSKKVDEFDIALKELQDKLKETEERLDTINDTLLEVASLQSLVSKKTSDIESLNSYITKVRGRGGDTTKLLTEETALQTLMSAEEEVLESKKELVEENHYMGLAAVLLKDGGIKKKIIKHYIPVINRTINKYLSMMNFFVNFNLDDEFNETIKSRHRDIFTYASFSEGEKRKIDLALLFAWRAMAEIKNSLSTNLLILDEVLDGSLDDTSTEAFLEIVNGMRGQGVNVFVISHKSKEVLQDKFERHVQMAKVGNFSKMN